MDKGKENFGLSRKEDMGVYLSEGYFCFKELYDVLLLAMLCTKEAIPRLFLKRPYSPFHVSLKDGLWKRLQGKTYELHIEKCQCPANPPQV